jgi:hypothetical protein
MSHYSYPQDAFSNGWNEDRLKEEVEQNYTIQTELTGVNSKELVEDDGVPTGNFMVTFYFVDDLSDEEKSALDDLVADHTGLPPVKCKFHASSTIIHGEEQITESEWVALGGVVTTPQFFCPVDEIKARIVGSYKTDGNGAQIRVVEDGTRVLGTFDLPGSASQWTQMQWFTTTPPTEGTHEYTIEAIKGVAGSAAVRFVSMSLLEFYL